MAENVERSAQEVSQGGSVEDVRRFLDGKGRLLEPSLKGFFSSQMRYYDSLEADMAQMHPIKRKVPFLEMAKKRELRTTAENIKYAYEVFGRYADMFDNAQSLPRVATEMAKWGAEEFMKTKLERKKGSTLDGGAGYEERRTRWFTGMEKMMKAAEAWRMLVNVSGSIAGVEATTRRVMGDDEEKNTKAEFVVKMYEFMDKNDGAGFDEFAAFLDSHLTPYGLKEEERTRRLNIAKDRIRELDGYSRLDLVALRAAEEAGGQKDEPLFYEYMWMLVSGRTDRYNKVFTERLKVVASRESRETTDMFTPKIFLVANETDVGEGLAQHPGDMISVQLKDLKNEDGSVKPWFERKMRETTADAYLDDGAEGAVWLAMQVDLSKVLGENSAYSEYVNNIGAIERSLITISVPVSVNEAKILAAEYSDRSKSSEVRNALIDAYVNRTGALTMWHGFGADERVYLTPAWAQIAYEAAEPDGRDKALGNLITEESIKTRTLGSLLSDRFCGVVVNVLGGKGTGIDVSRDEEFHNTAGSMERASWYTLEVQRALGLIPGKNDNRVTINLGHSMGGQIAHRLRILTPESVRGKFHTICLTPLSTKEKEINTFMHGKFKNVLGDVVIQSRHSKYGLVAAGGRGAAKIGKATGLEKSIINDMIIPPDAEDIGTDKRECNAMIRVHEPIYEEEDKYVARQRGNLEGSNFSFAQYSIDDLLLTSGIAGGSDMTVLVGEYDEVLSSDVQKKNYRDNRLVYSTNDFTGQDWKSRLDEWANVKQLGVRVFDPKVQVLVGNFGHYPNTNATGRYFMKKTIGNILRRPVKFVDTSKIGV